jgi:hypothetical protein
MPSKHFIGDRSSFVDDPRRPWPSRWRYCSGASEGGHYIGTYGGPPMSPLRFPDKAKAPRSLIAVSIRPVQRYARARRRTRELPLKSHLKGEAKFLTRASNSSVSFVDFLTRGGGGGGGGARTTTHPQQRATERIGGYARKPEARSTREALRISSAYGSDRTRAYEARVLYLIAFLLKQAPLSVPNKFGDLSASKRLSPKTCRKTH